ncbi:MAG TPA: hypothetical protein VGC80_02270, partial [Acetobacteraceae bacterium]
AQGNIGAMYALGHGVPQDYVTAYLWFNLAASDAVDPAMRRQMEANRALAVTRMSPEQVSEALRLARDWKPPQ